MLNFSNRSLLLIDDDSLTLKITKKIFETIGFDDIKSVCTAKQGLNIIRDSNGSIDLIVLDLNMPDMDGIQTIRKLGELQFKGELIIFSGEDPQVLKMSVALAKARNITTIGTIIKPASKNNILEILKASENSIKKNTAPDNHGKINFQMLKNAVLQGEFEPWFQPIVRIDTKEVMGVETLARWPTCTNKMIPPDIFIPLAEQYNLIDDITEIVVQKIIKAVQAWILSGVDLCISLNISATSLKNINFPEQLYRWFKKYPEVLKKLTIEITESKLIDDILCPLDVLLRLNLKKVKLSIDDFGTGYSDINQLKSLPFNELKIDKSYVHNASQDDKLKAILESSISLGKKLDMTIVAEGVENLEDWECIKILGCDYAQGYFIAKPMPQHEIISWIKNWPEKSSEVFKNK